jgi:hypothetical protein
MTASAKLNGLTLNGNASHQHTAGSSSKPRARRTKIDEAINTGGDSERKQSAFARYAAAQEDMLREFGVPTGTRAMVALGCGLVTCIGVSIAASALIDMLVLGALTLTGSAIIGMLVWVIGVVLTIIASIHAASASYAYVASGRATVHVDAARGWLGNVIARVRGHE